MYDIIGDIHGCFHELMSLTKKLGYVWENDVPIHPNGRKLAFVGDLADRGPQSLRVIDTVVALVQQNKAVYVPGNHCDKLYRFFLGRNVQITHGLETTVAEWERADEKTKTRIRTQFMKLYEDAPLYAILDDGKLVIAHAGIRGDYIGKSNQKVKTFVLYGDITGEKRPDGSPCAPRLGKTLPGRCAHRIWTYAGQRAALAKQHRQHRHRLRIRRTINGASLSRNGDRFCSINDAICRRKISPV